MPTPSQEGVACRIEAAGDDLAFAKVLNLPHAYDETPRPCDIAIVIGTADLACSATCKYKKGDAKPTRRR